MLIFQRRIAGRKEENIILVYSEKKEKRKKVFLFENRDNRVKKSMLGEKDPCTAKISNT